MIKLLNHRIYLLIHHDLSFVIIIYKKNGYIYLIFVRRNQINLISGCARNQTKAWFQLLRRRNQAKAWFQLLRRKNSIRNYIKFEIYYLYSFWTNKNINGSNKNKNILIICITYYYFMKKMKNDINSVYYNKIELEFFFYFFFFIIFII